MNPSFFGRNRFAEQLHQIIMSQLNITMSSSSTAAGAGVAEDSAVSALESMGLFHVLILIIQTLFKPHLWISLVLSNDFFMAALILMMVNFAFSSLRNLWFRIITTLRNSFFYTVHIDEDDESYHWLLEWLSEQEYAETSRNLTLRTSWSSNLPGYRASNSSGGGRGGGNRGGGRGRSGGGRGGGRGGGGIGSRYRPQQHYDGEHQQQGEDSEKSRPRLFFVPALGRHFIFYKRHLVWFVRFREGGDGAAGGGGGGLFGGGLFGALGGMFGGGGGGSGGGGGRGGGGGGGAQGLPGLLNPKEGIVLSMFGFSKQPLVDLIHEAMELSYARSEGMTGIYTATSYRGGWVKACQKSSRSFESVILREGQKEEILADVVKFGESRAWYKKNGIPFRRGYMLYGPPGTGKTSFITALAGELNMSVCVLSLSGSGMNDDRLMDLLTFAPKSSIILLEDVDSAFVKRDARDSVYQTGSTVTFSGLLNALDGIASDEFRITFLTTNRIDQLSPSLLRPGRVDVKQYLGMANTYQIRTMVHKFFSEYGDDDLPDRVAELIPSEAVSPAELQGFLLKHRDDPSSIIDNVPQLLEEVEKDRRIEEDLAKQKEEALRSDAPQRGRGGPRQRAQESTENGVVEDKKEEVEKKKEEGMNGEIRRRKVQSTVASNDKEAQ